MDDIAYTRGRNPKPPLHSVVESWLENSWKGVSVSKIQIRIKYAVSSVDGKDCHITKHEIYGQKFLEAWENCQNRINLTFYLFLILMYEKPLRTLDIILLILEIQPLQWSWFTILSLLLCCHPMQMELNVNKAQTRKKALSCKQESKRFWNYSVSFSGTKL